MKKTLSCALMLALALLGTAAATWEGSAVAGGAGDFPADGLYAACNSFPRDSVIELSNLENGKTVTVTVISNVDNPGVFIALSPKTAEALGMKPGAAVRVRAISLAASQAEATLPAARTGVSADPDFNPRVFFEREKAALQAASAEPQAPVVAQAPVAAPVAPTAPTTPAASPAVAAATPVTPATPAATPQPTAPTVAQAPAAAPVAATPKAEQKAEVIARAEAAPVEVPAAKPGLKEPQPTVAAAPAAAEVPAAAPAVEQKAEVIARKAAAPVEGSVAMQGLKEPQPVVAEAPAKATVDTLARPSGKSEVAAAASLAEPYAPETAPEGKPETVLSRISAPTAEPVVPLLTDAEPASKAPVSEQGMEALALTKPSSAGEAAPVELGEMAEAEMPGLPEEVYVQKPASSGLESGIELAEAEAPAPAEAIGTARPATVAAAEPAEVALGEPVAPKEPAQTGVVAIGGTRPVPGEQTVAEMADPEVPAPAESLAASKPGKTESKIEVAMEPGVRTPRETGSAPTAIAAERPVPAAPSIAVAELAEPSPETEPSTGAFAAGKPTRATSPDVALASPTAPSPSESLSADRPTAPPSAGETVVALEPALPRPPAAASAQPEAPTAPAAAPTAPTAVATIKSTGGIAEPPASLPVIKGLAKGSYYIQIGVYGTNDALLSATAGLRPNYPVAIERISTKAGASAYRLYIGPIARDESGLALLRIRSMGYKDAFVKQGT